MVDDRHPVAGFQQLGAFHHVGTVGVHHHQQGVRFHLQERIAGIEKHVLILRQGVQPFQHGSGGIVIRVDDDVRLLAPLPGGAANACRRAHSVHIREGVAHDVDLACIGDQLPEGVGHDPRLHLGALFRGFGTAAVKREIHLIPHHRLIAAPAQRHFQRQLGVFVQLRDAGGVHAHADGQGGMNVLRHLDAADGIQNGELFLHKVLEILFFKEKQVMIPVGFQQDALSGAGPDAELFVDLCQNGAALGILAGFHQILVVVQHQNGRNGTAGFIDFFQVIGLRGLHPVGGGHHALDAAAAPGAHQTAVDPEAVAVQRHPLRAFLLAGEQPLDLEVRRRFGKPHLKKMLPDTGQLQKALVAPDDLPGIRPEHQRRQGGIDEGGLAGGVHAAGHGVDVLQNALAAFLVALPEVDVQQRRHHSLRQSQLPIHGNGRRHEQQHEKEVEFQVRLQQSGKFLVAHSIPRSQRGSERRKRLAAGAPISFDRFIYYTSMPTVSQWHFRRNPRIPVESRPTLHCPPNVETALRCGAGRLKTRQCFFRGSPR